MNIFFLIVKIIFSMALVSFFILRVDYGSIKTIVATTSGFKALTFSAIIILLQACIGGVRLPFILRAYGHTINALSGIRIWLIGSFFSQTMISFVGGDAMRVWCLTRSSISTRTAASIILLDRVIGFCALILLFIISLPYLMDIIVMPAARYSIILLALASTTVVILFLALGYVPGRLRKKKIIGPFLDLCLNSRYLFLSMKSFIFVFTLSIGVQLLNIFAIYSIFYIYGVNITFFWCLVLAIPAMLISMLPISIAGWGVRESAMVMGFSLLGLPTDTILAASVTFGLAVFLGGIPGVFLFLFERKRRRPHQVPDSTTFLHN